jgi:hypothetical protein
MRLLVGSPSSSSRQRLRNLARAAVVHRELAARQQAHLGHRVQAALAVGVEGADAVDLVVEQVHAVGHGAAHGEQVDQPAAHRVLAGAHHLGDVAVAGQGQLALEPGLVELLLDLEVEGVARQEGGWRQPVQRRGGRHDHHVGAGLLVALLDAPQRGQSLADQVLVRREGVIGQGLPVRKQRAAQVRREEGHFVDQALRVGGVGGDDGRQATGRFFAGGQAAPAAGNRPSRPGGAGCSACRAQVWVGPWKPKKPSTPRPGLAGGAGVL